MGRIESLPALARRRSPRCTGTPASDPHAAAPVRPTARYWPERVPLEPGRSWCILRRARPGGFSPQTSARSSRRPTAPKSPKGGTENMANGVPDRTPSTPRTPPRDSDSNSTPSARRHVRGADGETRVPQAPHLERSRRRIKFPRRMRLPSPLSLSILLLLILSPTASSTSRINLHLARGRGRGRGRGRRRPRRASASRRSS